MFVDDNINKKIKVRVYVEKGFYFIIGYFKLVFFGKFVLNFVLCLFWRDYFLEVELVWSFFLGFCYFLVF